LYRLLFLGRHDGLIIVDKASFAGLP